MGKDLWERDNNSNARKILQTKLWQKWKSSDPSYPKERSLPQRLKQRKETSAIYIVAYL